MQIAFSVRREKRKATPAEKLILDSYLGFGAIKCIANPNPVEQWHKSDQPLYPLVQFSRKRSVNPISSKLTEATTSNGALEDSTQKDTDA